MMGLKKEKEKNGGSFLAVPGILDSVRKWELLTGVVQEIFERVLASEIRHK